MSKVFDTTGIHKLIHINIPNINNKMYIIANYIFRNTTSTQRSQILDLILDPKLIYIKRIVNTAIKASITMSHPSYTLLPYKHTPR